MTFVVSEANGIKIVRVTKGDTKDYWRCLVLGSDKEEKHTEWEDVLDFIKRKGK